MKNRIDHTFQIKQNNILSIFFTAGYPVLNSTIDILKSLDESGADMIEIGIPYSDPIADGPVIQNSSDVAIKNGMNLKVLFQQLQELRSVTQKPILLMGYLNCVLQYGIENFYKDCHNVGIDGLILPDLPIEEYECKHKQLAQHYNIHVVFLVSPSTNTERILQIDNVSKGFIYVVSSNATTGSDKNTGNSLNQTFEKLNALQLKNPLLIGFGIKNNHDFKAACQHANGAIIGSAFINAISESNNLKTDILNFVSSITSPNYDYSTR